MYVIKPPNKYILFPTTQLMPAFLEPGLFAAAATPRVPLVADAPNWLLPFSQRQLLADDRIPTCHSYIRPEEWENHFVN